MATSAWMPSRIRESVRPRPERRPIGIKAVLVVCWVWGKYLKGWCDETTGDEKDGLFWKTSCWCSKSDFVSKRALRIPDIAGEKKGLLPYQGVNRWFWSLNIYNMNVRTCFQYDIFTKYWSKVLIDIDFVRATKYTFRKQILVSRGSISYIFSHPKSNITVLTLVAHVKTKTSFRSSLDSFTFKCLSFSERVLDVHSIWIFRFIQPYENIWTCQRILLKLF